MKKIGIIGCGTIGTRIAEFIQQRLKKSARVVAICDIDVQKAEALSAKIRPRPSVTDMDSLIEESDFVVEAAGVNISNAIAEKAIQHRKDVFIMSSGGLLESNFLFKKARARGCNIHIPSGAICGLDGIKSGCIGKIKAVTLTTKKPLRGLKGAPYFRKKGIDIKKIDRKTVLFDGNARKAIKYFPQNVNVAATLGLAGVGAKRTRVRIITSPHYTRNIHEIEMVGEFGRLYTRTENRPSRENPKTSMLAIFSALAKLKEVI